MIAALYVETAGCYFGVPGVDPWDEARDARAYAGPHPVVAHPPCQRWGRFHHGSTRKPHQFRLSDDGGCFAAALMSLNDNGGVIEHPCDSKAWRIGMTAMVGGKDKTKIRNATPVEFRDVLISIARTAHLRKAAQEQGRLEACCAW